MNKEMKSILVFDRYEVNNIEFRLNKECTRDNISLDLNIQREVTYIPEEKIGEVKLITKVFENPVENNYPFSIQVEVTGVFKVETEDSLLSDQLLNTNAVAILFPYIRALISTYTANANVEPLILPAINVNKLLDKK